ncbi:MAG: tetratricopeptide repeat protein [Gemmataceae bacterium]
MVGAPGAEVQLLRAAQQRRPGEYYTNSELSGILGLHPDPAQRIDAIGFKRAALALRPQNPLARSGLGQMLIENGRLDEAIAQFREGIRLKPEDSGLHSDLGTALRYKGLTDEAIAECKEAIRLKPDNPFVRNNLGSALHATGDMDGAVAEFREAIRIKSDYAQAHYNLGLTLGDKGDVDGAIAEYREAIRLEKNSPRSHCNLGQTLILYKGQFAEALTYLRRGHELGSKEPRWPFPSARWVKECERFVELDGKLPRFLKGEVQPADVGERLTLARMCQLRCKWLNAAAARFYAAAFAEQPQLADDLQIQHRHNAASAAALAGCGKGNDAANLAIEEYAFLRQQALIWLRADLAAWRRILQAEGDKARATVLQNLTHWQQDPDFAGVRGQDALAKLPEDERLAWEKLWEEVAALKQAASTAMK